MKWFIPFLAVAAVLCSNTIVVAKEYGGQCIYFDREKSENKFHSCLILPSTTDLKLVFKSDKYQDGNQTIAGNSITQIASGNYAKRLLSDAGSIIGSILFAPVGIASRVFNKNYQEYIVDYSRQGKQTAIVVRVALKDAPEFQQELRALARNRVIHFEDPKKSTLIKG